MKTYKCYICIDSDPCILQIPDGMEGPKRCAVDDEPLSAEWQRIDQASQLNIEPDAGKEARCPICGGAVENYRGGSHYCDGTG